jgi:hypothetical protein
MERKIRALNLHLLKPTFSCAVTVWEAMLWIHILHSVRTWIMLAERERERKSERRKIISLNEKKSLSPAYWDMHDA